MPTTYLKTNFYFLILPVIFSMLFNIKMKNLKSTPSFKPKQKQNDLI